MMVRCPHTDELLGTGEDMDAQLFRVAEVDGGEVFCPGCGTSHTWSKKDVLFTS